jgi:hypothetical protein
MNCMNQRLASGADILRETADDGLLAECVSGLHKGKWIMWASNGLLMHIGSEEWVRPKWEALVASSQALIEGKEK